MSEIIKRSGKIIGILVFMILLLTVVYDSEKIAGESNYYMEPGSRILREGDEGPDVALLQHKLRKTGFFSQKIDGFYDSYTREAVLRFQSENKLKVDGIAGPETLGRLPAAGEIEQITFTRGDVIALARIIHGEARGESMKGKIAVGAVVKNRVHSEKFADNILDVILTNNQFSSLYDGQAYNHFPSDECILAARFALTGYDPTGGALFFYNPDIANLEWISTRPVLVKIGDHVFAR